MKTNHAPQSDVMNWFDVSNRFRSQREAEDWLVASRWPSGAICPECGSTEVHQVVATDGLEDRLFECHGRSPHGFTVADGTLIEHYRVSFRDAVLLFHLATNRVDDVSRIALLAVAGIDPDGGRQVVDRIAAIRRETLAPRGSIPPEPEIEQAGFSPRRLDERSGQDLPDPIDVDPSDLASTVLNAGWQPHYGLVEPIGPDDVQKLMSEGWSWREPVVRDLTCREFLSGLPSRLGAAFRHLARIYDLDDPFDQFTHLRMCVMFIASVEEKFKGVLADKAKDAAAMIRDFKNGVVHELENQTKRTYSLYRCDENGESTSLSWAIQEPQTDDGAREDRPLNPAFTDFTDEVLHNDIIRVLVLLDAEIRKLWAEFSSCSHCRESTPVDFCVTCCQLSAKVWRGTDYKKPRKPKKKPRKCDRCQAA